MQIMFWLDIIFNIIFNAHVNVIKPNSIDSLPRSILSKKTNQILQSI